MPSVAPTLGGPLSAASGQPSAPPRWTLDAGSRPLAGAPASAPADAPPAVSTGGRVRPSHHSLVLRTEPFGISPGLQGAGRCSEVTASPASSLLRHTASVPLWHSPGGLRPSRRRPSPPLCLLPLSSLGKCILVRSPQAPGPRAPCALVHTI